MTPSSTVDELRAVVVKADAGGWDISPGYLADALALLDEAEAKRLDRGQALVNLWGRTALYTVKRWEPRSTLTPHHVVWLVPAAPEGQP